VLSAASVQRLSEQEPAQVDHISTHVTSIIGIIDDETKIAN